MGSENDTLLPMTMTCDRLKLWNGPAWRSKVIIRKPWRRKNKKKNSDKTISHSRRGIPNYVCDIESVTGTGPSHRYNGDIFFCVSIFTMRGLCLQDMFNIVAITLKLANTMIYLHILTFATIYFGIKGHGDNYLDSVVDVYGPRYHAYCKFRWRGGGGGCNKLFRV